MDFPLNEVSQLWLAARESMPSQAAADAGFVRSGILVPTYGTASTPWWSRLLNKLNATAPERLGVISLTSSVNEGPKLADRMNGSEADVFDCMTFPAQQRTKLHSAHSIERLNNELKRRADIVGIFST